MTGYGSQQSGGDTQWSRLGEEREQRWDAVTVWPYIEGLDDSRHKGLHAKKWRSGVSFEKKRVLIVLVIEDRSSTLYMATPLSNLSQIPVYRSALHSFKILCLPNPRIEDTPPVMTENDLQFHFPP
ncbi:hypothetical protein K435DRAFT_974754 [Dendrothele bispora CBS 962.96]|uniref:Uncharacterized protein n=1 Tax=Dendrothele bispora (strain CBS 962.96) TaxID=1314807 RepID=A0A4S8KKF0_DENBC|nr:hypothetical protein K435DRAFT_974754 [Dendrothele bispora CBS 962.96]